MAAILIAGLFAASGVALLLAGAADARPTPAAGFTLNVGGLAPTAIGLGWAQSSDLLFSHYSVLRSATSSSGPWTTEATYSSLSSTSFYGDGLAPSGRYFWQVEEVSSLGTVTSSQIVDQTQPGAPSASAALHSARSAAVAWSASATLGDGVTFVGFRVLLANGSGALGNDSPLLSAATRSFEVGGLGLSGTYRFAVAETVDCAGASNCGSVGQRASTSQGAPVTLSTPSALGASASVGRSPVAAGTSDQFSCAAAGGTSPYSMSWTFGDGRQSSVANPSHTYSAPGTYRPVCSVTDSLGQRANATVEVTVSAATNGSSGNGSTGGTPNGSGTGGPGTGGTGTSHGGPPGGTGGPTPVSMNPASSFTAVATVALVLILIAATGWLAYLATRRGPRRSHDAAPGPASDSAATGEGAAAADPNPPPPSSGEGPAGPSGGTEGGPTADPAHQAKIDLDELFDRMERDASR